MCVGVEICNYCENNEATDVEHIYPKSLFPERAFRWDNYLLSCGTCNTKYKSDGFAVFDPANSENLVELVREQPPLNNDGVFINPRLDNPTDFLFLDFLTFRFTARLNISLRDQRRTEYTIALLKLNDREALVAARRRAANYYFDRLERYVRVRDTQTMEELIQAVPDPHLVNQDESFNVEHERIMDALRDEIKRCVHPTVWYEMKEQRQRQERLRKLNVLLTQAPEALDW